MPTDKALVKIYVSDAEHETLRAQAAERGLSVSALAHARLFGDAEGAAHGELTMSALPVELRAVLSDHAERLAELEAWHERSRAMLEVYEARGWRDPLEDPDNARILKMSEFRP